MSASSSEEEDRLGEVMTRHGRITRHQFEDASSFIKSGWKLGEILAELNVIEEPDIEAFVRLQLLDIACTQLIEPPSRVAFSLVERRRMPRSTPLRGRCPDGSRTQDTRYLRAARSSQG